MLYVLASLGHPILCTKPRSTFVMVKRVRVLPKSGHSLQGSVNALLFSSTTISTTSRHQARRARTRRVLPTSNPANLYQTCLPCHVYGSGLQPQPTRLTMSKKYLSSLDLTVDNALQSGSAIQGVVTNIGGTRSGSPLTFTIRLHNPSASSTTTHIKSLPTVVNFTTSAKIPISSTGEEPLIRAKDALGAAMKRSQEVELEIGPSGGGKVISVYNNAGHTKREVAIELQHGAILTVKKRMLNSEVVEEVTDFTEGIEPFHARVVFTAS